jgi:hypothetical protein
MAHYYDITTLFVLKESKCDIFHFSLFLFYYAVTLYFLAARLAQSRSRGLAPGGGVSTRGYRTTGAMG